MMRPLDFRQASQIAYTMAATAKTPAASIKISAISKPAIVRAPRDHERDHDTSSSSNALASFRSRVSNPSVNQP